MAAVVLPSVEAVAGMSPVERAQLRVQLLALLTASMSEAVPPSDPALTLQEAAQALGRSVDWFRRSAGEWHDKMVTIAGAGFIMQPADGAGVRYSLAGLEALKRHWLAQRTAGRPTILTAGRRNG